MPKKITTERVNERCNLPVPGEESIDIWFEEFLVPMEEIKEIIIASNKPNYSGDYLGEIKNICSEHSILDKLLYISSTENISKKDVLKNSDHDKLDRYTECVGVMLGDDGFMCQTDDIMAMIVCMLGQLVEPSKKWLLSIIGQKIGGIKSKFYEKIWKLEIKNLKLDREARRDPSYIRDVFAFSKEYGKNETELTRLCLTISGMKKDLIGKSPRLQFEYLEKNLSLNGKQTKAFKTICEVCGYSPYMDFK